MRNFEERDLELPDRYLISYIYLHNSSLRNNDSRSISFLLNDKKKIIYLSPGTVGKDEFGIVKQVTQENSRWWHLGQKDGCEDTTDARGTAVLSLESSEEQDQVAQKSMIVTRQLVLQQVSCLVDPILAVLASCLCNGIACYLI